MQRFFVDQVNSIYHQSVSATCLKDTKYPGIDIDVKSYVHVALPFSHIHVAMVVMAVVHVHSHVVHLHDSWSGVERG